MKSGFLVPRDSFGRLLQPGHAVRLTIAGMVYAGTIAFILPRKTTEGRPAKVGVRLAVGRPRLVWVIARWATRVGK